MYLFLLIVGCKWLMGEVPMSDGSSSSAAPAAGRGVRYHVPAFNTLFVNLAPNNQRVRHFDLPHLVDVGIGAGMLIGGYIGQISTLNMAYLFGAC